MTPTQRYIADRFLDHYNRSHPTGKDVDEASLINSFVPSKCIYCGSERLKRDGFDDNGIQRLKCRDCGRKSKPTTGTVFDSQRIPASEWIELILNLFRYLSINAMSWNNKNAFTTSKHWMEKLFLTFDGFQESIVLEGQAWIGETYYSVLLRDRARGKDGKFLPWFSRNKICIGVATDGKNIVCIIEGKGKPTAKGSCSTLSSHIKPGSTLVHDKESTHGMLVEKLGIVSEGYASAELKDHSGKDNPLDPVNRVHDLLKKFLKIRWKKLEDNRNGFYQAMAAEVQGHNWEKSREHRGIISVVNCSIFMWTTAPVCK